MSGDIPGWLSAIGILFTIAAVLGAAVAVYRTSIQATTITELEASNKRLRDEIADYERREHGLKAQVVAVEAEQTNCRERITAQNEKIAILQEVISGRTEDAEIRSNIAELKRTMDERILGAMNRIAAEQLAALGRMEGLLRTHEPDGGNSDA